MTSDSPQSPEVTVNAATAAHPVKFSLQRKAWLVTTSVLVVLAGTLGFGVDLVFRRASAELENEWVAECARRTIAAQTAEVDVLERTARDYSAWTDTYEFAADGNQRYIDTNLVASMFANLQLDAFVVYGLNGKLVTVRGYEDGGVVTEGLEALTSALAPHSRRVSQDPALRSARGVIRVGERLAVFGMQPILRDDDSGPVRGALAHVRFLSPARVARLRETVNLPLALYVANPSETAIALPAAVNQPPPFTTTLLSDAQLRIDIPVLDANGGVVGRWEMVLERDIFQHGAETRLVFYIVLSVLIVAATLVIGWLLRSMVIAPLEALNAAVQRVGTTGDLSVRLPTKGSDELASLNAGVNRMFGALEQWEMRRAEAERDRNRLSAQLQESQRLEALGTLAGGLAHDFNNLLTSILGSIALLRLETSPSPTAEPHFQRLKKAAEHAAQLVRQMMAFGRRGPTSLRDVHLSDVVRDALNLAGPSLPRGIAVSVHRETDADLIHADPSQIQQVLINLATNAAHAMSGGSGALDVTFVSAQLPDPTRPETARLPAGDYLRVAVRDTGCGIPPDHLPHVFEPFYTTKPVGSGSGLGLSVAHGIISSHGGSIGIESEVGRGTTVIIHLPRVRRQTVDQPKPRAPLTTGEKGKLLLVDDDVLVRETLVASARRLGYQVVGASGGAEALQLIDSDPVPFDAVVTDQMMPGMTGTQLGERLANLHPELPVILISGDMDGVNLAQAAGSGLVTLLPKPVTMEELDRAIQQARRERRDAEPDTA
jgi:signal transduction histidine kinase/CheY-like chemotaxis protein